MESIREIVSKKLGTEEDFENISDEEKTLWVTILSNSIATLLMCRLYEPAKNLTLYLMQN